MKRAISKIINLYDKCMDGIAFMLSISILVMVAGISIQVFSRYLFDKPVLWTTDLANCILVALGFLGAGWLLRQDGHVTMDLVYNLLGKKSQRITTIITSIMGLITSSIIMIVGYSVTYSQYLRGTKILTGDWNIPKFIILLIIPVGMTFVSIEFVRKIKIYLMNLLDKQKLEV